MKNTSYTDRLLLMEALLFGGAVAMVALVEPNMTYVVHMFSILLSGGVITAGVWLCHGIAKIRSQDTNDKKWAIIYFDMLTPFAMLCVWVYLARGWYDWKPPFE